MDESPHQRNDGHMQEKGRAGKISVYKSRRKDAAAEFISLSRGLRVATIQAVKKFPTSYRWIVTNNMLALAGEIYTNAIKANSIYVHKDISRHDFELRRRYLMLAVSSAEALLGEITFCYEMVDTGNNFFEGKTDYNKLFQSWTTAGNDALKKLRAVADSDKKRWNTFRKKEQEQKE